MTSAYEFEGKTKEEAIIKAADKLGISEDELEIEVLSYGSTGIFGLVGVKKAKIKVTVKPAHQDSDDEALDIAKKSLETILSLIPVDTTVEALNMDGNIILNIEGDNSGLLIGRRGKTLDALQFIVNKIVNKKLEKK